MAHMGRPPPWSIGISSSVVYIRGLPLWSPTRGEGEGAGVWSGGGSVVGVVPVGVVPVGAVATKRAEVAAQVLLGGLPRQAAEEELRVRRRRQRRGVLVRWLVCRLVRQLQRALVRARVRGLLASGRLLAALRTVLLWTPPEVAGRGARLGVRHAGAALPHALPRRGAELRSGEIGRARVAGAGQASVAWGASSAGFKP